MTASAGALVIGEALVDIVRRSDGSSDEHGGGSPANVAVALARLGRDTSLATDIADDRLGEIVRASLTASGVRLLLPAQPSPRTSSALATIGADGAASYVFDLSWRLDAPTVEPPPVVVHTGSIGAVLDPGSATVRSVLESLRPTSSVTYDLNIRPAVTPPGPELLAKVESLVAVSDLVKASDEDLESLYPSASVTEAAQHLLTLGPAVVLVTRGRDGATALWSGGTVSAQTKAGVVADTIGAGDTFMAGSIDALWQLGLLGAEARGELRRADAAVWRTVLDYAAAAAAVTVSRPGADPPWRRELPPVPSS